jgi:hypothetical protein
MCGREAPPREKRTMKTFFAEFKTNAGARYMSFCADNKALALEKALSIAEDYGQEAVRVTKVTMLSKGQLPEAQMGKLVASLTTLFAM